MNASPRPPKFTPVACVYVKGVDVAEVDQFGFIDLRAAFLSGVVPGDLLTDPEAFNGVDDPASLVGRPTDVFDAYRKADYVMRAKSALAAKAEAAAASSAGNE